MEEKIEVGVYYYVDEETGEKIVDTDEMRDEFERKLKFVLNENKQKNGKA